MIKRKRKHQKASGGSLKQAVDFIIAATSHSSDDVAIRSRIERVIKKAISMSRVRGGEISKPEETAIYQYAAAAKTAKSPAHLRRLAGVAAKNIKSSQAKTAFGLLWEMQGKAGSAEKNCGYSDTIRESVDRVKRLEKRVKGLEKTVLHLSKALARHRHPVGKAEVPGKRGA